MTNRKKTPSWLPVLILAGLGISVIPHPVLTRTSEVSRALSPVLSSYELIRMEPGEIEQQVRTTGELRLRFDETDFYFNLEPHDMRAPNYRAVETGPGGVTRTLPPQPVFTFKGVLAGREDTRGRFNLVDGGVEGVVYAPEGWVYVEPLRNYLPGASAGELVVYSHSDIKPGGDFKCGASLPERLQRGVDRVTAQVEAATPTKYEFEVATEADYEYVQALGGSEEANREILGILNQVDGVYQSELLLQLRVSFQRAWTMEDPYHKTDKNVLLDDFRDHWNNNFAESRIYDVAHLWTGKTLTVYGTATRGAACRFPSSSYGLSTRLTSTPAKYALTAHEIGHNFGATHPHAYNPPIAGCHGTIMRGSDYIAGTGAVLTFCEFSRQQIARHVAGYNDCLTPRPIWLQPPSDLTATTVSTSGIDLSWRDRSTNETGFRVERRPAEGNAWIQIGTVAAEATTFSSRGLFPGDTYRYRVQAFNETESSAFSNEAVATTLSGRLTRTYWTIDTIAGGGVGDNGPAVAAQLHYPGSVAVDGAGNLYIADTEHHRIRRIDSSGTIATIAGTGEQGSSGDGGPAFAAQLNLPAGVAVDGAGNLYIADRGNHRIRRIDASGTITTIAGTGERGFSGDGGPAVAAQLNFPVGVAVDGAGNLYIADEWNNRIRRVDLSGTITTIAGTGRRGFSGDGGTAVAARLNHPNGVAVDGAGNLIADSDNHRIRRIDLSGTITTSAGTGERGFNGDERTTASAQLSYPTGMAFDGAGNLVFADTGNNRIRRIDASGTIATLAGTGEGDFSGDAGPAVAAQLNGPYGVAMDSAGNLVFADSLNNRIRRIDLSGTITTIAGTSQSGFSGDGGPAVAAELNFPEDVAIDGSGYLYIADTANHRIRRVDPSGTIATVAGTGEEGFSGDGAPAVSAQLSGPKGVAVDGAGNLYIADSANHRIRRITPFGIIATIAGTGEAGFSGDGGPAVAAQLSNPQGLTPDGAGNLYIADTENHRIRRIDTSGTITTLAGTGRWGFSRDGGPAVTTQLGGPKGVAVDGAGNVYITDADNNRIRRVDASGIITTIAGTGERGFSGDGSPAVQALLAFPQGVAIDRAGNLVFADADNNRIRRVDSSGTITTFAGTGEWGFSGDNGPAVQARLRNPDGVAVDGSGNLYIADTGNHRIRIVTLTTPPTALEAPSGLTATAVSSSGVDLNWRDNSDNETGFRVQRRQGDSDDWVQVGTTATNATTFSDVGLLADTLYHYRVQAFNDTEPSAFSNQAAVTTSSLHPPSSLTATAVSSSGIDLSWQDNSINETGFRVQRQRDGSSDWVPVGTAPANATNFSDAGLLPGTRYRYRVQAFNESESSAFSNQAVATTRSVHPPRGLTARAISSSRIDLSWQDNNIHETGFRVQRRQDGASLWLPIGTTAANATTFLDVGLLFPGTRYRYRVQAFNETESSVFSNEATATTLSGPSTQDSWIIETIAGGSVGDGGPAVAAHLDFPEGVAVDGAGNLYIADRDNHRIRRIDFSGIITTIAGTGVGFSGDGGPAGVAQLRYPRGIAADGDGNLYIGDTGNHRIRWVDASGVITTIAGTGGQGFGGDNGLAVDARLLTPERVALDGAGNVYITDTWNHRIRRVDPFGIITTIAGTGEQGKSGDNGLAVAAQFSYPQGVAVDGNGDLYIADTDNHRIRRVDATGTITTIAGTGKQGFRGDGGPAVTAQLSRPESVAVDGLGNVYIADSGNHRIRVVTRASMSATLPPPTNLMATAVFRSGVDLSWQDNSGNEAGFRVQRRLNSTDDWIVVGTTAANATTYSDVGLLPGTPYQYRVQAFNDTQSSFFSNEVVAITVGLAPTVAGFVPMAGPVGTRVTLTGTYFLGATEVLFNRVSAPEFEVVSGTSIEAVVPSGATSGPISVVTPGGTAVSAEPFTVVPPPTLTRFTPTAGPAGTGVTLTGTHFLGATDVRFNGVRAAEFEVVSGTTIEAVVPPGATSGPISVVTPGGTAVSAEPFTVVFPPTLTRFTPTTGPVGTRVTLTGTHFLGATEVRFNGVRAVEFEVVSGTSMEAVVPPGATSGPISVVTPGGTAVSAEPFTVVFPPTLTRFTPATGPVGTRVTLTGTHFLGATAVRFNGVGAVEFEVVSGRSMEAVVPPGATSGPISVVTPGGMAVSAEPFTVTTGIRSRLFVPVVLRSQGRTPGSFFTSEMTLTNRGSTTAEIHYTYRASFGVGSGTAVDSLGPGRQRIVPDAIAYLASLGVPIGEGVAGGTLVIDFSNLSSTSDAAVTVRTSTPVEDGDGQAGLAYYGINQEELLTGPVVIAGLRQNRMDRSNVALQNAGDASDGAITLRVTVYSGDPETPGSLVLPARTLAPGGFHQYNGILNEAGFDNGYVKVERVRGTAAYYAYGVINDNFNSDGSFVIPVTESSLVGTSSQTLPVIVETRDFTSELTVTNFSDRTRTLDLRFVADSIETDGAATFSLTLQAGEQSILPNLVDHLRGQEVAGIGPAGRAFAGALFSRVPEGDMSGIVIGARTGSPGGGGQYGVFYNAVPDGSASTGSAWIYGLQQNATNRSNLALVNTGEVDDGDSVFSLDIYDGETGNLVRTISRTVPARGWHQINGILRTHARGIQQGYVRIRKLPGNNPFLAYGVINDGGAPGQRSGDGAFLPSQ